jgi:CRP/FNR family cyclic AMP-dependent transcriptional regulator
MTLMRSSADKANRAFDPKVFLATLGEGRKSIPVLKKQPIFAQGDAADAIFYIKKVG